MYVRKEVNNFFSLGYNYIMRKLFAILVCKIIRKIGNYVGRGSSLPGKIALKICPDILSRLQLPELTIAVTGSNGKTSTVEMIQQILNSNDKTVAYNYEGSNQIEGITTLIIDNSDYNGKFLKDVLLMEVDERYAKHIFKYFAPKYYVINNLYRDQLTRNGNPEYVMNDIKKSIRNESILILNADDPLIASLAEEFENEVVFFGMGENEYVKEESNSIYDDGYYCPVCKSKMIYDYRQYGHVGKYHCSKCGFERPDVAYEISDIDLHEGKMLINNKYEIKLALNALYNAYNVLSAFTVGSLLDLNDKKMIKSLNSYLIKNGRFKQFRLNNRIGTLLISKHENSLSYNSNIEYVLNHDNDISIMFIIDDISRKYFTSDTSWIWDINFELLKADNIKEIIIAGKYINDLAVRFKYAGFDMEKIMLYETVDEALKYLDNDSKNELFVLTCFSDEAKLLKEVEQT